MVLTVRHRMFNRQRTRLAVCRGETIQRSRSVVSCFARTRGLTGAISLIRKNLIRSVIRLFYRDPSSMVVVCLGCGNAAREPA